MDEPAQSAADLPDRMRDDWRFAGFMEAVVKSLSKGVMPAAEPDRVRPSRYAVYKANAPQAYMQNEALPPRRASR